MSQAENQKTGGVDGRQQKWGVTAGSRRTHGGEVHRQERGFYDGKRALSILPSSKESCEENFGGRGEGGGQFRVTEGQPGRRKGGTLRGKER